MRPACKSAVQVPHAGEVGRRAAPESLQKLFIVGDVALVDSSDGAVQLRSEDQRRYDAVPRRRDEHEHEAGRHLALLDDVVAVRAARHVRERLERLDDDRGGGVLWLGELPLDARRAGAAAAMLKRGASEPLYLGARAQQEERGEGQPPRHGAPVARRLRALAECLPNAIARGSHFSRSRAASVRGTRASSPSDAVSDEKCGGQTHSGGADQRRSRCQARASQ